MQNFNTEKLKTQIGVYEIRNIINNKVYIGSTIMSFHRRWDHHRSLLRANTHKNVHLQRAWNKHGEENFIFNVLEIVAECCTLDVEQTYLDTISEKYNINPLASGTPNMSQETIDKRAASFKITTSISLNYLKKVRSGEINIEDVPDKYLKLVRYRLESVPWNKGLTLEDTDYSYLRVPKTTTDKLKQAHKNTSIRHRESAPEIFVYNKEGSFLGSWNCSQDLADWSKTDENNLPIVSRFKGDMRMGIPVKHLLASGINKSANTGEPYKGIYFSYTPLSVKSFLKTVD